MIPGTFDPEAASVPGDATEIATRAAANRRTLEQVEREAASWLTRDFAGAMLAIHPPDALPPRSAFDPVEVPKLLPHLILVTVERNPYRFLVKLTGQSMRDAIKTEAADAVEYALSAGYPDAREVDMHVYAPNAA